MTDTRSAASSPALTELRAWNWPPHALQRSGQLPPRLSDWWARRQVRRRGTAAWSRGRAGWWSATNEAEDYGVVIPGTRLASDPGRTTLALQVCRRMPQLAAALLARLADHPPRADGAPRRWSLDHLSFHGGPDRPPTAFMAEVRDEDDPVEQGGTSLQLACGWRLDRPRDPLVVFGPLRDDQPWPPGFALAEPARERHAFLDFLRDGRLAGVAIGDARAEVERRWGPPLERTGAGWDGWGPTPGVDWQGECSVAVNFDADGRVEGLSIDLRRYAAETRELPITAGVVLDLQGFSPGLEDEPLQALLASNGLAFERAAEGERWDDQRVAWTLASGVELVAWNTDCTSGLSEAMLEPATRREGHGR